MQKLDYYIEKYGSDKKLSRYTELYEIIFKNIRDSVKNLLEIGIGTLDPTCPSSFVGNTSHYPNYSPGGSLRAWRDYFHNSFIEGIDIGQDCLLKDDRIQTYIADSQNRDLCEKIFGSKTFDIIIDDGLHTSEGQWNTYNNFFHRVKPNGYYVIEDIGGGGDGKNMFEEYEKELTILLSDHQYYFGGNILIIKKDNSKKGRIYSANLFFQNKDMTIVSGLWNINRHNRDFSHYIENFKKFLDIDANLFLYVPKELEDLVWSKRNRSNTYVKIYELEDVKTMYSPFWEKTQKIRNSEEWLNKTGEQGWLKNSPQATLQWYNPIVQSKIFLLNDVTIWNPFGSKYFMWLDSGITNTVNSSYLTNEKFLSGISKQLDSFLFLSYPYEAVNEIHGFDYSAMNRYSEAKVEYVCRGGLFGGTKESINEANGVYYSLLDRTLSEGYMGTEESIFTIMSYLYPEKYRRYSLNANGLIVKFVEDVIEGTVKIEEIPEHRKKYLVSNRPIENFKISLYILTFNFPHQVEHTIKKWLKHPKWITNTRNILIDNSTNEEARIANSEICEKYNFEHIITNENTGINGGRQRAAEHFDQSDSDYYIFLEDDMGIHPPEKIEYCRNGFRMSVPHLYDKVIKIMSSSDIDFLKLSFTEVYMDNNIQVSWYNVPQTVRTQYWPNYDKLPITGLDPNCPRTEFDKIENFVGLCYATGDIYYCNWPTIMGKVGNRKVFLETKWARPYEQTWMSYVFQETKKGNIKPAVLLASPIDHDRIAHYKPEERREN